ncbi:MAG: hypothetical protein EHM47_09190 [Ignavibacteriales bacterium]|nr:MAG: hypothetical protein EHM47_09190 [Ignavibacteriales bacterium]
MAKQLKDKKHKSIDEGIGKLLKQYIYFRLLGENKLRKSSNKLDEAFEAVFVLTESIKRKYN